MVATLSLYLQEARSSCSDDAPLYMYWSSQKTAFEIFTQSNTSGTILTPNHYYMITMITMITIKTMITMIDDPEQNTSPHLSTGCHFDLAVKRHEQVW